MIKISDIHYYYGDHHILRGINLDVNDGEVISIVGPSGSGKSTLLYCINGLQKIASGEIFVDEIAVHDSKTNLTDLRKRVGMVFQQWNAFPHLTALRNVTLALTVVKKMEKKAAQDLAVQKLEEVGLGDKIDVYPSCLSGGQQQRLAIARALAMEPGYMLFDEATSALDPQLVSEVLDTIRALAKKGMTMICVTHEMHFAQEVSDKVAFFYEGRIEELATPSKFFSEPKSEHLKKFLSSF